MTANGRTRVAIACQGGGSHTAFTAGVLQGALANLPADVEVVALSGTSGGAICAALAWEALVRGEPRRAIHSLQRLWESMAASDPWDQIANQSLDRRPAHLDELREFGRTKWRWFLKERETRVEQSSHKGAA